MAFFGICLLMACRDETKEDEIPEPTSRPAIWIHCLDRQENCLTVRYVPGSNAKGYAFVQGEDPSQSGNKAEGNEERIVTYRDLNPDTEYTFSAVAWNEKGEKGLPASMTVKTRKRPEDYTCYFTVNGEKYELLEAAVYCRLDGIKEGKEWNYRVLCLKGENAHVTVLESEWPHVIPYYIWPAGRYTLSRAHTGCHTYTCTVTTPNEVFEAEGVMELSYQNEQMCVSLNGGNLQLFYKGAYNNL